MPQPRVRVDGFNPYCRLLAGQPDLKWPDLPALAAHLMPGYDIDFVRYFTALLKPGMAINVQTPRRQQIHLRALNLNPPIG